MKLRDIIHTIKGQPLYATEEMLEREYSYCVASDMMSNVMLDIVDDSILITGLVNPQVIRASEMMNITCIVITCGKAVNDTMIDLAATRDIAIVVTDATTFTVCGQLHTAGLREGPIFDNSDKAAVLEFIPERCNGCVHCARICPTEAIRIKNGKVVKNSERCIACGKCIAVCPRHAIRAKVDSLDMMDEYDYRIAVVSSAFYGQFAGVKSRNHLLTAIKRVGFDDVIEDAVGADMVGSMISEMIASGDKTYPLISSGCHAVVNLIQIRFPNLLEHVIEHRQTAEIVAAMARREAKASHPDRKIGVFYIAPCTSRISYAQESADEEQYRIDGVFAIYDLYRAVKENLENLKDDDVENLERAGVNGLRWGGSGGASLSAGTDKFIAIDGIEEVIDIFERLEDDKLTGLEFIEANACTGGCFGGCLTMENIYSAKANSKIIVDEAKLKYGMEPLNRCDDYKELMMREHLQYKPLLQLDEDLNVSLKKMEELGKIARRLPGIDCGVCGAPTCRAFAEDVVRGLATGDECILAGRGRGRGRR